MPTPNAEITAVLDRYGALLEITGAKPGQKTKLLTVGDAFQPRKVTEAMAEGAIAALSI